VATLLFGAAAHAYSDEAVKDAEKLVKTTSVRFSVGEVTDADMALARYHLETMKYHAQQVAWKPYCSTAKAQFTVMAKSADDEAMRTGLKPFADKIAVMSDTQSACALAIAALDVFLFGAESDHPSADDVKQAAQAVDDAAKRLREGEVSKVDLARAKADLLAMTFAAREMSRSAYCKSDAPALLRAVATGTDEEAAMGQRGLQDVIGAKRRLFAVKTLCHAG
jgi:hypothetical protein